MAKNFVSKFYHKGINVQKSADIIIDLKRPDIEKLKAWSLSERITALAFLNEAKSKFESFVSEAKKALQ